MFGIFFPWMHSQFLKCEIPSWVYFLDPGLSEKKNSNKYWRPDSLPLDTKTAQKYIEESLLFGRQFQDPREISYLGGQSFEDFFSDTSMAIRSEIRHFGTSSDQDKMEQSGDQFVKAQMALLLAWYTEENVIGYQEIEQGLQGKWNDFWDALGILKEDLDSLSLSSSFLTKSQIQEFSFYSWQKLMPWFLCFLREEAVLFFLDPEIYQTMVEHGVTFDRDSSCESHQENGLNDLWSAQAYGWKLCLQSSPSKTLPWLNKRYEILFGQCI